MKTKPKILPKNNQKIELEKIVENKNFRNSQNYLISKETKKDVLIYGLAKTDIFENKYNIRVSENGENFEWKLGIGEKAYVNYIGTKHIAKDTFRVMFFHWLLMSPLFLLFGLIDGKTIIDVFLMLIWLLLGFQFIGISFLFLYFIKNLPKYLVNKKEILNNYIAVKENIMKTKYGEYQYIIYRLR